MLSRDQHVFQWVLRHPRVKLRICVGWLLVAVGFELLGRWSPSDGVDAGGVLGLGLAGAVAVGLHGESIGNLWTERVKPTLRERLAPWGVNYGADLRGAPALPYGHPVAWVLAFAAVMLVGCLVWFTAEHYPTNARLALRQVSGLGWLMTLGSLWAALVMGTVLAITAFTRAVGEFLLGRGAIPRSLTAWALFSLGVTCVVLPVGVCLVALVAMGLAATVMQLLLGPKLRMIWKPTSDPMAQPRWAIVAIWNAAGYLVLTCVTTSLVILACGDGWQGMSFSSTAVTGILGALFAKSATLSGSVLLLSGVHQQVMDRLLDPARQVAPRVRVEGASRPQRRAVRRALRHAGMRACFKTTKRVSDAVIMIDPGADPFAFVLQRVWPLAVCIDHLQDERVHELLRRRTQIQRRRGLARGLSRVFKAAAARKYTVGTGFWVAPHLWFQTALSRDDDDALVPAVSPPYRRLVDIGARSHLYEVLRDLEIDLVFVEDGVGFRNLQRVYAKLFEFRDRFGARSLEESYLSDLRGLHVVVHDLDGKDGHGREGYPEPDYESLGRARLLHVFRDRGGEEERELVPESFDYLPVPVLI
ncbi:MAG: hypothetical protein ACI8QC_003731 [Planctomycetota bacterium]|jgi:hypothetical protein